MRAFVGTFWPVRDDSARRFASIVHTALAEGQPLGHAIRDARSALYQDQDLHWGNFVLYGSHSLVL